MAKKTAAAPIAVSSRLKASFVLDARILKKSGSFYYHCDWHASDHVKVMLDQIFSNERN